MEETTTTINEDTKWYVLRVVSGKEKKVKEYLDKEIQIYKWQRSYYANLVSCRKGV